MGVWDKLDDLKKRAQRELAERAAKAAVDRSKEAARAALDSATKRIGDVLFGEDPTAEAKGPEAQRERQKAREDDAGRKLREAAARQADRETADKARAERDQRESEARAARAKAAAEAEKQIDDELAALKKKIGK